MDEETKKKLPEADGYFGEGAIDLGDSLDVDWLDKEEEK
jgi:hypothetical protein